MPDLPTSPLSPTPVPAPLVPLGERLVAALRDAEAYPHGVDAAELDAHLTHLAAASDFAAQSLQRTPGLLADLLDGDLAAARTADDFAAAVSDALDQAHDEPAALRSLRQLRRREMVRIAWRDLLQIAAHTRETLDELSALAEALTVGAMRHSHAQLAARHGEPLSAAGEPQELIALGMGKLGGRELNFSSDIDLVFAFAEGGVTSGVDADGRRSVDNGQFFTKVAQRTIALLNETTADGFVFRVDMRLRPFGASGPLVMNFDGLEAYYLTQGREWERYAMIKARPLGGRPAHVAELEALLRPFIYRRYLDYGAIDSLRDLKQTMVAERARKGGDDCVKLGVGGIREIEFVVQSFQLVRGGRDVSLQRRGLVPVLHCLGELGLLSVDEVQFLLGAYDLLRRLENRLQMLADQQTHALPTDDVERLRMAHAMGEPDWASLMDRLDPVRARVHTMFRAVFAIDEQDDDAALDGSVFWAAELETPHIAAALQAHGYTDTEEVAAHLAALRGGAFYARLSAQGQARLDRVVPRLVDAALEHGNAATTLDRLLGVLRAIAGRSGYVQVLIDNPQALALLVRLCSAGRAIADFIARHPLVIDELLSGDTLRTPMPREALEAQARAVLAQVDGDDLEGQMNALRQFRHGVAMRVAVADVLGTLPVMKVSDQLSWLAEAVLAVASDCVWQPLVARHGAPRCQVAGREVRPSMAIVAYGKLGGLELGYASDLDLVFLHDSAGEKQETDGERPLDNRQFFARYVQRLTQFLSAATGAGVLYEIDTRLRPNGQSGLLVSSLEAFEHYQRHDAWIWEHQALTRARVVVGDTVLADAFGAVRERVLREAASGDALRDAVREMRERMRRELSRADAGRFDLKQDPGGIADIEFMVQYGVLAAARNAPELLAVTDNVRQLERLPGTGLIDAATADTLSAAYLHFRETAHRLSLQGEGAVVAADDTLTAHRSRVVAVWNQLMNAAD